MIAMNQAFWNGRSVLVTGHTGFKGGWLTLWLHQLKANIHGYALNPPTDPNLFEAARIKTLLASDTRADLLDLSALKSTFKNVQPEVVFHLAAQPLVRESYRDPLKTLATNVMGTAHVLEAARTTASVKAIIIVTTDKVYESMEWAYPFREVDPLGAHDPYSASKAAAEIVTASYRSCFFDGESGQLARIATVRAGNVIGGGDWAADRLVPDCLRAFANNEAVCLRYPKAVRPWQHVLEPISGYLKLAELLSAPGSEKFARAWNFGPDASGDATTEDVAQMIARFWGDCAYVKKITSAHNVYETGLLRLDSTRARTELGWKPQWSLQTALQLTVHWYRDWLLGLDMQATTLSQIVAFSDEASGK